MASPRYPAPGVTGTSFPTPNLSDKLLVERYDHDLATFGPYGLYRPDALPEYGTEHPDTGKHPDFNLVLIKNTNDTRESGRWFDWYWVNERTNQDEYNYAIVFDGEDNDFPMYAKDYVYLREGYTPLIKATTDPGAGTGILVREKMLKVDDEILNSLFVHVQRIFRILPGAVVTSKTINKWGTTDTTTVKDVAAGSVTPVPAFLTVDETLAAKSTVEAQHTVTTVSFYPVLYDYDVDDETRQVIQIKYEVVAKVTTPPAQPSVGSSGPYGEVEIKSIDDVKSTKITRSVAGIPNSRDEYRLVTFPIPALLYGFTGFPFAKRDGERKFTVNAIKRAGFRKLIRSRIHTDYGRESDMAVPNNFYQLLPNDLIYDGVFFNIAEQNVLNDAGSFAYTNGTTDPIWPPLVETYSYSASVPSLTAYLAAKSAETEILIGASSSPWRYGLWKRERVYIIPI